MKFGVLFFFLTATGEGGWGFNGEAGPDDKVRHSGGGNKFDPAVAGDGSDLGGAGELMCEKPNLPEGSTQLYLTIPCIINRNLYSCSPFLSILSRENYLE